jgi:hypothetical protein
VLALHTLVLSCVLASASSVSLQFDLTCVFTFMLTACQVFSKTLTNAMKEIDQLRERVDAGELVPGLGAKADAICNEALETFSTEASETQDKAMDTIFDSKVGVYDLIGHKA